MNENLDIFICTHKDFDTVVTNSVYKVLDSREIKKEYKIFGVLDDVIMSEWLHFFYVYENMNLKNYVGFCHYRRYYDFLDDVPNVDEIFETYDIITRAPISLSVNIETQYKLCHNVDDLYVLGDILKEKYIEYYETYENLLKSNKMIPCNMFIMKTEDFKKFMDFNKEIIKEFLWRVGINFVDRIKNNENKYIKSYAPNNTYKYQIRLLTYVLERLTNIYILKNFKNIKTYNAVITENKYNLKNNNI